MKETLIKYRLEQAEEALAAAQILYDSGQSYRGAVNRAYYAMFYAVLALLAKEGKGTSKHSGAIAMFDEIFVKTKVFPKTMSKQFHDAFEQRQTGDYKTLVVISRETAHEIIKSSRQFVTAIKAHLEK